MKNPLVLFVGAAVVAVAALAGATADRWRDWPGPVQPPAASPDAVSGEAAEPAGEPESRLAPTATETDEPALELRREQSAETEAGPAPQEPDEQVAAVGADEIEIPEEIESAEVAEAPVEKPERLAAVDAREVQPAAPSAPAEPDPKPDASAQPSFDVVRLEEDGSLIVAGLAAPGAKVTLLLDGEAIASDAANDVGAWLLMPDARLPPGSHQLMVQARDADSGAETSGTIAVAVPERSADRSRLAHSEPAQPPAAGEEPARLEPEEPTADAAEEEQVALAPVQEPDVEVEAPVVEKTEAEPEEHAAVAPQPEVELEPAPEPVRREIPLALETVDYNDDGDIVFSGRADPGSTVRIHVDNRFVGESMADADGRWAFAGDQIAPGRHTLRADLMGADDNVFGRIILPFVRADGREVSALVEARRGAVVRRQPELAPEVDAPEPAEAEPEPEAPVVAEEVAPEPEPEAPAVIEVAPEPEPEAEAVVEVRPEPEPEAPEVADGVAPEPEPEAPVVVDEVAPETEPGAEAEAPAVAELAPEPEPEVPAVVDVAPEPEPEAPVVAEEVAPEPELEAPVVVDVAPEPEPEAPVVAEEIAPVAEPEPDTALTDQAAPEPDAADQVAAAKPEMIEPVEGDEVAAEETVAENGEPEAAVARPGHVVIQPGNNLWRISRVIYGRGIEYTAIYEANRDKIRDPDLIYPGQIFATPGVDPPKEIDPEWREPLSPEDLARQDAAE